MNKENTQTPKTSVSQKVKKAAKDFVAPDFLKEDEPLFTLDHDGGLVVNLDVINESGQLDRQKEGVQRLKKMRK